MATIDQGKDNVVYSATVTGDVGRDLHLSYRAGELTVLLYPGPDDGWGGSACDGVTVRLDAGKLAELVTAVLSWPDGVIGGVIGEGGEVVLRGGGEVLRSFRDRIRLERTKAVAGDPVALGELAQSVMVAIGLCAWSRETMDRFVALLTECGDVGCPLHGSPGACRAFAAALGGIAVAVSERLIPELGELAKKARQ